MPGAHEKVDAVGLLVFPPCPLLATLRGALSIWAMFVGVPEDDD